MARSSRRNFLTTFRHIGVDPSEKGPDVSQDVQLVYVVDDIRQTSYIYAGAGITEGAVVGEHAIISIQCRVPRGMEIEQVQIERTVPAFGEHIRVWTSATLPTTTGSANLLTTLRTTGLAGLPAAPLSNATSGTILTANIPTTAFRQTGQDRWQRFFINESQFFNMAANTANLIMFLGIRWRELRLFPSP